MLGRWAWDLGETLGRRGECVAVPFECGAFVLGEREAFQYLVDAVFDFETSSARHSSRQSVTVGAVPRSTSPVTENTLVYGDHRVVTTVIRHRAGERGLIGSQSS